MTPPPIPPSRPGFKVIGSFPPGSSLRIEEDGCLYVCTPDGPPILIQTAEDTDWLDISSFGLVNDRKAPPGTAYLIPNPPPESQP